MHATHVALALLCAAFSFYISICHHRVIDDGTGVWRDVITVSVVRLLACIALSVCAFTAGRL